MTSSFVDLDQIWAAGHKLLATPIGHEDAATPAVMNRAVRTVRGRFPNPDVVLLNAHVTNVLGVWVLTGEQGAVVTVTATMHERHGPHPALGAEAVGELDELVEGGAWLHPFHAGVEHVALQLDDGFPRLGDGAQDHRLHFL